jgi:hypothetical protein
VAGRTAVAIMVVAVAALCAEKPKELDPRISAIYPVAGQRGTTFDAEIRGSDLAGARSVVFEGQGIVGVVPDSVGGEGKSVKVRVTVAADAAPGRREFRVVTANGVTNKIALDVVSDRVQDEAAVSGPLASFPAIIAGRLAQPGESDAFWIEVAGGETLTFEAVSGAASFDPSVTLYEQSGSWFDPLRLNRIAFNDEPLHFPGLSNSARLVHRFSRGGKYCLKVQGFAGQGGHECVYELRIQRGVVPTPVLHPEIKAIFDERQFTRALAPNRLAELARRGGAPPIEQAIETFHAALKTGPDKPIMTVPGLVEGRIEQPGDTHWIRVKIDRPQDIAIEIETPEATMPRFNPVVRLMDPVGREIATDVYTKLNNNGLYMMKMIRSKTALSLPAPGEYSMQIRDITTSYAGPDFRYRVLVRPQIPHVGNVEIAEDRVNVKAGASRPLTVTIDREEGFRGYAVVNVEGLPTGVTAIPALENPEEKPPLPNGGRLERYVPREQRTALLLVAGAGASPSGTPVRIRVVVRVVSEGRLGEPVAVKEIPLMVLPGRTS